MTPGLYGPIAPRPRKPSSLQRTTEWLADRWEVDADGCADPASYARRLGVSQPQAAQLIVGAGGKVRRRVHGNRKAPTPQKATVEHQLFNAAQERERRADHADAAQAVAAWFRDGRSPDRLADATRAVLRYRAKWGRHVYACGYGWYVDSCGELCKFRWVGFTGSRP